jgi:hypothetical protein
MHSLIDVTGNVLCCNADRDMYTLPQALESAVNIEKMLEVHFNCMHIHANQNKTHCVR